MNAAVLNLRAWGFADEAALERALNPPKPMRAVSRKFARGRFVSRAELYDYASARRTSPTSVDVMAHFECSRAAAYRYRAAVLDIMAMRKCA